MANYANLKSTIDANVNTNGTEAITGAVLNSVLKQMVSTMGEAGYLYKGVATPATSPGTPDTNVWYLASTAGTYTNFGGAVVADGEVAILKYNGSWTKEVTGAATAAQVTQLGKEVGDLEDLQTTDKSSIVAAINEAAQTGGGGSNLTGYVSVASVADLPDPGEDTLGYLIGEDLYLYVGTGGDTLDGKYQNCGPFRGPAGQNGTPGAPGQNAIGFEDVSTQEDGTIVITLTSGDTITIYLNHEHPQYPKYVLLADEAAYEDIDDPDADTLYLIPEESE